jgi:uncharacterized protein YutE (UPF0331/DUF86 family)
LTADQERLQRLLELVNREDHHLLAVRQRLLNDDCDVTPDRVAAILSTDLGIDRLESFGAKFGRMQDTVIDKLVPTLLRAAGESTGAAIDNLSRLERIGLIESSDAWLEMRRLRNRLVHEYMDRSDALATALERACRFTEAMHDDVARMRDYVQQHLIPHG